MFKEERYERGKLLIEIGEGSARAKDVSPVYPDDRHYRDVATLVLE
ncbi:MAG: hypothetical protein M3292_07320 [Actinomycetota bacterium]|nr:hypothetical protein [Actinomycetota bacterium]